MQALQICSECMLLLEEFSELTAVKQMNSSIEVHQRESVDCNVPIISEAICHSCAWELCQSLLFK